MSYPCVYIAPMQTFSIHTNAVLSVPAVSDYFCLQLVYMRRHWFTYDLHMPNGRIFNSRLLEELTLSFSCNRTKKTIGCIKLHKITLQSNNHHL